MPGGFIPDSAFCAGLSLPDRDRLNAAIMQVVDDCIVAIDEQGRVIEFNPAAEITFGWSRTDVLGRPLNELIVPPVHRAAHQNGFARYLATGEKRMIGRRVETEATRADGSIFPVEISIAEVPSSAGRLFAASLRDISERRRKEAEQHQELTRLNQVLDALPIGIFVKDRDGRYLVANLEARRFNLEPERSWIGLTDVELFRPELAARFRAADERVWSTGEPERSEMTIDYIGVEQSFLSGKDIMALADGREAILGFIVDITARKAAEDEVALQREALHQAVKMSALGSLLANVAHELNNPLSILLGHAIMLQEEIEPGTEVAEMVGRVHAAAERCARIVKTFLDMARQRPSQRSEVQLNQLIRDTVELMVYGLRSSDIAVRLELDPDLPILAADGDQLGQVLVNLIVNAQQAMHGQLRHRLLRITTHTGASGGMVQLEVADSGPGIPPEIVRRMFEPFFTTKAPGSGTGLGMSVCRSIVEAHQGTIGAATSPAGGALIIVELPVRPCNPSTETRAETPAAASFAVLVVDDEPEIAAMLGRLLNRLGHSVDVALDGHAALARIEGRHYDVIISDIRMPGLDGPSLWRRIAVDQPRLARRVLFITGDTLSGPASAFLAESGAPCVEKPFRPAQIQAAIESLLAGSR